MKGVGKDMFIALLLIMGLLIAATVAIFGYSAACGWKDTAGIGVGAIFIAFSIFQALFMFYWLRAIKLQVEQGVTHVASELKERLPLNKAEEALST